MISDVSTHLLQLLAVDVELDEEVEVSTSVRGHLLTTSGRK